jgi:hypothetical protein
MGLQLPGELVTVMNLAGITWPDADEEKLFGIGQTWLEVMPKIVAMARDAHTAAGKVWDTNTDQAIEAFQTYWQDHGPAKALANGAQIPLVLGLGLVIYAALVLLLKIWSIIQLVILTIQIAQAIATAVATLGASLLQIPIFRQITKTIVDNLKGMVVGEILSA